MNPRQIGRISAAMGGLLLASCLVTGILGLAFFVKVKVVLALICFIIFFMTNWQHLGTKSSGNGSFYAGVTIFSCVGLAGLLCLANYAAAKRPLSWDMTREKVNRLSDASIFFLGNLSEKVEAVAFYRPADEGRRELESLFEKCSAVTPMFVYEFVDPVKDPLRTKQADIRNDGPRIILKSADREVRVQNISEEALTNGIRSVAQTVRKKIAFISGHGESKISDSGENGLSKIAARMKSEGLDPVEVLNADIPEDINVAVLAGPASDLSEQEIGKLRNLVMRGGRILFLVEPFAASRERLDSFLAEFDVAVPRKIISDKEQSVSGASSDILMISNYNPNEEITRDFTFPTVFPGASPVLILTENMHDGITASTLSFTQKNAEVRSIDDVLRDPSSPAQSDSAKQAAETSLPKAEGESGAEEGKSSGSENSKEGNAPSSNGAGSNDQGPFPIGVRISGRLPPAEAGEQDRELRIVVFGDVTFAANGYSGIMGNADLFLNTVNWLAQRSDKITIRPRSRSASALILTPERHAQLFFLIVDLLPLSVLAFGIVLWMIRRSR